jgi:hypothetical protein
MSLLSSNATVAASAAKPMSNNVVRRAFKRGALAASETAAELLKRTLRKVLSCDPLFVGDDSLLSAIFFYKKADKHDERGRAFSAFLQGNGISGGASLSAKVFGLCQANADIVASLAPNRAKVETATDCFDYFVDALGDRIYDIRLVIDPVELTDENPEYPEREAADSNGLKHVYYNARLAFADEVGEVMTAEEAAKHPAIIAMNAELEAAASAASQTTM